MGGDPTQRPGRGESSSQPGARSPGEDTKTSAEAGKERVKAEASRTAEQLQEQGEDIAATAKERAVAFTAEQKRSGAQHVDVVARAVRKAAEELEQSSPELARYARDAASSVGDVSNALRERSVGELVNDVNGFAKRQPGAFFAAAIATGFALSRFLKSSGEHHVPPATERPASSMHGGETDAIGRQP